MIFVHPSRFYDGNDIEIAALVKLQTLKFPFWKIRQVAGDKMILLRPQMTKPQIQTLLEEDNLDVRNLNSAVSIILELLFAIWIGSSWILTVSTLLPLVGFWMKQNPTSIASLSVLLNGDDVSAKKLLI